MCHESKVDEFIESLKFNLKNAYGNCETPADSGKIVNEFHYNRLCDLFKDHGGEIVIGNQNTYQDRNLKPTLILNPDKNSELMKDEIFGPIFPLITYSNLDEAIQYTQDLEKPLVVYYFGDQNGYNYQKVLEDTSSGSLVVNDTIYQILNTDLPFGGVGNSGYGRYHGISGFKTFSNMKSVLVKPPLDVFPFNMVFPPYTEDRKDLIVTILDAGVVT